MAPEHSRSCIHQGSSLLSIECSHVFHSTIRLLILTVDVRAQVFGPGISRGVAGEAAVFSIEARDEVKNK